MLILAAILQMPHSSDEEGIPGGNGHRFLCLERKLKKGDGQAKAGKNREKKLIRREGAMAMEKTSCSYGERALHRDDEEEAYTVHQMQDASIAVRFSDRTVMIPLRDRVLRTPTPPLRVDAYAL